MNIIYQILNYNLKGAVLKTWQPYQTFDSITEIKKNTNGKIISVTGFIAGIQETIKPYSPFDLSEKKIGYDYAATPLLPYFANVTEDLPSSCKWEPKTYENCQLLAEKHGTYLEFWHEPTKQKLRIAMNSHTYEQVSKPTTAKKQTD